MGGKGLDEGVILVVVRREGLKNGVYRDVRFSWGLLSMVVYFGIGLCMYNDTTINHYALEQINVQTHR